MRRASGDLTMPQEKRNGKGPPMTTEVESRSAASGTGGDDGTPETADVFVVFGITGDLAKVMTFNSLYRLEERGLLDCPIVGVAVSDWSAEDLRTHAHDAIAACGTQIDDAVFDRFAARLSYVSGDFGDAATYERVKGAIGDARCPVFYLEIPPFLFGTVIKGLTEAGVTKHRRGWWSRSRSVTIWRRLGSWRRRSTSTSTSPSCTGSTTSWGRWGSGRSSTCGSRTRCSSRSGTATTSRRSRSRWPRASAWRTAATSTTRSGRCATWSSTT